MSSVAFLFLFQLRTRSWHGRTSPVVFNRKLYLIVGYSYLKTKPDIFGDSGNMNTFFYGRGFNDNRILFMRVERAVSV